MPDSLLKTRDAAATDETIGNARKQADAGEKTHTSALKSAHTTVPERST